MNHREQIIAAKKNDKRFRKGAIQTYSTVSQSRMPRRITQSPREGRGYSEIPGGEFTLREEDPNSRMSGNPEVLMEDTITPQRLRIFEQIMNNTAFNSNPPGKIPNDRGQSGSSGVYRANVGTLTQSIPQPFEKLIEKGLSKSWNYTAKGYRCRDCGVIVFDKRESSLHAEKGCTSGFDLVK